MLDPQIEELIEDVLADGVVTDTERRVLHNKAVALGIDPDEVMVVVEARLHRMKKNIQTAPPPIPGTSRTDQLRKCPNCGTLITRTGAVRCDACGMEFVNITAVNSIAMLDQRLYHRGNRRPEEIICSFAVPNTREDLLEFMIAMRNRSGGRFNHYNARREEEAYIVKYFECVDKANIYFGQDPQFVPLLRQAEADKTKWISKDFFKECTKKWNSLSEDTRDFLKFPLIFLLPILFLFLLYLLNKIL